ncbi:histidine ammonia-lyase [bacterium]|nr:histidine ammonia-lyase [bacterium]
MSLTIDDGHLTIEDVEQVAIHRVPVAIGAGAYQRMQASRDLVLKLIDEGAAIYGVTTGIGELARIRITQEQCEELQRRIIYSHCASAGDIQPEAVVRAAMLCRTRMLCQGYSGVRPVLPDTFVEMLNKGVTPVVYEKGSVGCSGDLSPLSMMAIVLLGEGEAFYQGRIMPAAEALKLAGIEPIKPTAKEGLGMINGTQMMAGEASLQLCETIRLYKNALIAFAMALDALKAVTGPFNELVHRVRPYDGAQATAAALRQLFADSEIMADLSGKVQDGYSMRCTPQVMGATLDTFHFVRRQVETEINSVIDNPLFFSGAEKYFGAGNFHGQPLAMAMDFIAIATSEVASLAERHTNRLLNPTLSGLPDFLIEGKGLNSGLMVAQYTQAAVCSENRVLCHPAVVDNVSVSADQEDHVNMGPVAIRKYKEIIKNTRIVLAIEMYAAAQAMDFRARGRTRDAEGGKKLKPGKGTGAAYEVIRQHIPFMEDDRAMNYDIKKMCELIESGEILEAVEGAVGEIKLKYQP